MSKTIVITGAGSGFGEGAAIGLAKAGHVVIAGAQIWPQVSELRAKAKAPASSTCGSRSSIFSIRTMLPWR